MTYGVDRVFKEGDIHTFIDIGANGGYVAAKVLEIIAPDRIIALEPCKETFEGYLLETNKDLGGVLECYNVAYGCGEDLYYLYKRTMGMRRFLTEKEREYWLPDISNIKEKYYPYPIESKTLEGMFQDYSIDFEKSYIIKMDCEGCERFLLENDRDLLYVKNADMFAAEFHFFGADFDGTPRDKSSKPSEFAHWIWDNLSDTHNIIIGKGDIPSLTGDGVSKMTEYFSTRKLSIVRFVSKEYEV